MPGEIDVRNELEGLGVLITGATGFTGKVLIEKLLRSIPKVKQLYVLVRGKKGISPAERIDKILDEELYFCLREQNPDFKRKITVIEGDCSLPDLGLSQDDKALLIREINIIVHGAAIVKFEEPLKEAYNTSVLGTRAILEVGKQMKELKGFIYVSTAFSQSYTMRIEEKFYETSYDPAKLDVIMSTLDGDLINDISKKITSPWPNTYSFCKGVAEHVVLDFKQYFPVSIIRPPNILGKAEEPMSGWTNNLYGPTGFIIGSACGILRIGFVDKSQKIDLVPVDYFVNCVIAMAAKLVKTRESQVYNFISRDNCQTWKDLKENCEKAGKDIPTVHSIWCMIIFMTKNWWLFNLGTYLLHYLPGIFIDFVAIITRAKMPRLMEIYTKYDKLSKLGSYFTLRSWDFETTNMTNLWNSITEESQELFRFDLDAIRWVEYLRVYLLGLRRYILKDDLSTLKVARRRYRMFEIAHKILCFILIGTVVVLLHQIFNKN